MNYWLTPNGEVYEGNYIGFHTIFCNKYLEKDDDLYDRFWVWYEKMIICVCMIFLKWSCDGFVIVIGDLTLNGLFCPIDG